MGEEVLLKLPVGDNGSKALPFLEKNRSKQR
jgi:hypothetical protein